MPFQLVNISQQDPRWKNTGLGFGKNSTIGAYGCAMTSVCMWLSGFGYPETPDTLNTKLKQRGGFVQDAIVWGAVSAIYPKVKYKNLVLCRDTDAPIDAISGAIAAGNRSSWKWTALPDPDCKPTGWWRMPKWAKIS